MSEPWVHDLSPFLLGPFQVGPFENVGIRWYGLAYVAGLAAGYWWVRRWCAAGRVPLQREEIVDFVIHAAIGMLLGGYLGYRLLYGWSEWTVDPLALVRSGNLFANGGVSGMSSHGGIIGLVGGMWWFARKRQRSFWVLADVLAATGPLGIGFGRIANFINGELWGRPGDVPWAVIFPGSAAVAADAPLAVKIAHAVPRHPSQLYAAMLEGFLVWFIMMWIHARHRTPGQTAAWFCILYAVGRFVGEFWREPDVGQPVFFGWMSKGQLFTIPFLLFGIGLLWWTTRRPARAEWYLPPPASTSPRGSPPTLRW